MWPDTLRSLDGNPMATLMATRFPQQPTAYMDALYELPGTLPPLDLRLVSKEPCFTGRANVLLVHAPARFSSLHAARTRRVSTGYTTPA